MTVVVACAAVVGLLTLAYGAFSGAWRGRRDKIRFEREIDREVADLMSKIWKPGSGNPQIEDETDEEDDDAGS